METKMRKTLVPDYLAAFRCIGSPCEDNCCIGWDVDFDRVSYEKYQGVREGELGRLFKRCVRPNPDPFSDAVDYATVRLKKDKVCPFLNEAHLCRIQLEKGAGWLSNVCATYPRYTSRVDGVYEHAATVSCPEAARLILQRPEGLRFLSGEEPADVRTILTYAVNTGDKGHPARVRHLKALREFTVRGLQNRALPLEERILRLGGFFEAFDRQRHWSPQALQALMRQEEAPGRGPRGSGRGDAAVQLQLMKELTGQLKVFSQVDSRRYIAYFQEYLEGAGDSAGQLAAAQERYLVPLMARHGYLLENYLVNFVFKDLFPAAEGESAFDAYTLLVIRYVLIRLHLAGIAAHRGGLTEAEAVAFIQAFSKTVEHHKTYLETLSRHMARRRYNTLEHLRQLLGGGRDQGDSSP